MTDHTEKVAEYFANVLKDNRLTSLHFKSFNLGCEGAKAIAKNINRENDLRILTFSNCGIGNEGASAILSAIEKMTPSGQKFKLDISGNNIDDKNILESFKKLSFISELNIKGNAKASPKSMVIKWTDKMAVNNKRTLEGVGNTHEDRERKNTKPNEKANGL